MRKPLDLNAATLDTVYMLVQGGPGVGKTHLLGDMLQTERQRGEVRFLNIAGEDGYAAIAGMGLGAIAETVETFDDYRTAIAEYRKVGLRALAVDSLAMLARIEMMHQLGSDRAPRNTKDLNESGLFNHDFRNTALSLRTAAPIVLVACPSDKSVDQISGRVSLTPDLPGRNASGCAHWFDFVFVLRATATGPTTMQRDLLTAPTADVVIRARTPRPLPATISIPSGPGGWQRVYDAILATYQEKR